MAGRRYTLYRMTNLVSGSATALVANAAATPPGNVYTDSAPGAVVYYYSVKVGP